MIVIAVGTVHVTLLAVGRRFRQRRALLSQLLDFGDLRVIDEELQDLVLAQRVRDVGATQCSQAIRA